MTVSPEHQYGDNPLWIVAPELRDSTQKIRRPPTANVGSV